MHYKRLNPYTYMTYSWLKGLQCIIARQGQSLTEPRQKDGLTSFLVFTVLGAKICQYYFLEGHV